MRKFCRVRRANPANHWGPPVKQAIEFIFDCPIVTFNSTGYLDISVDAQDRKSRPVFIYYSHGDELGYLAPVDKGEGSTKKIFDELMNAKAQAKPIMFKSPNYYWDLILNCRLVYLSQEDLTVLQSVPKSTWLAMPGFSEELYAKVASLGFSDLKTTPFSLGDIECIGGLFPANSEVKAKLQTTKASDLDPELLEKIGLIADLMSQFDLSQYPVCTDVEDFLRNSQKLSDLLSHLYQLYTDICFMTSHSLKSLMLSNTGKSGVTPEKLLAARNAFYHNTYKKLSSHLSDHINWHEDVLDKDFYSLDEIGVRVDLVLHLFLGMLNLYCPTAIVLGTFNSSASMASLIRDSAFYKFLDLFYLGTPMENKLPNLPGDRLVIYLDFKKDPAAYVAVCGSKAKIEGEITLDAAIVSKIIDANKPNISGPAKGLGPYLSQIISKIDDDIRTRSQTQPLLPAYVVDFLHDMLYRSEISTNNSLTDRLFGSDVLRFPKRVLQNRLSFPKFLKSLCPGQPSSGFSFPDAFFVFLTAQVQRLFTVSQDLLSCCFSPPIESREAYLYLCCALHPIDLNRVLPPIVSSKQRHLTGFYARVHRLHESSISDLVLAASKQLEQVEKVRLARNRTSLGVLFLGLRRRQEESSADIFAHHKETRIDIFKEINSLLPDLKSLPGPKS